MKVIKQVTSVLLTLAVMLLAASCSGQEDMTRSTEQGTVQEADEIRPVSGLETFQRGDETVLVSLDRSYEHKVPAGYYMEYALNNAGGQALAITLSPAGGQDLKLTVVRADDTAVEVLAMDDFSDGEAQATPFTPESGVNYLLRVYGLSGDYAEYAITIAP